MQIIGLVRIHSVFLGGLTLGTATMMGQVLVASQAHVLSLQSDGSVCSAGENQYGQLGDATFVERLIPTFAAVSGITGISTNGRHSLAVSNTGDVWSWGNNDSGQLGDGTTFTKPTPARVPNLPSVTAVAAGLYHSLALAGDGTVWAWGRNGNGQLGDGTTAGRLIPAPVVGLADVVAIAAGDSHSVALKRDGSVWTWGYNGDGELGDGTRAAKTSPVQVPGISGMSAIAAGSAHSLAIRKSDGAVWSWGYNSYGQLGQGDTNTQLSPVRAGTLTGVKYVAAGQSHSIALQSNGTVWAWGQNQYGQLGNRSTTESHVPVQTVNFASGAYVAAGGDFSFAVKTDGTRWGWGYNVHGQLGTGNTAATTAPVMTLGCSPQKIVEGNISPPKKATLAAALQHSLFVQSDGTICAVGENQYGQLGDGTAVNRLSPSIAAVVSGAVSVATGAHHSLAVTSDGRVWAWGNNDYGQLGDGSRQGRLTPELIPNISNVIAVAAGTYHSLALKSDGSVWAWGLNSNGQVGDGTNTSQYGPVQVIGINDVGAIAAADRTSAALKLDGTVWTWGFGGDGQLGTGSRNSVTSPVQVSGLDDAVAIAAGLYHLMVIRKSGGSVWAWGYGSYGQLGDGNTDSQLNLVRASGLTGAVAIAGGESHSLAVTADGTVWSWGLNQFGQLGNRTTTSSSVPIQVPGLTGAALIAAGTDFSTAIKVDGTRSAWGNNTLGQLGTGNTTLNTAPVAVAGCTSSTVTPSSVSSTASAVTASNGHSLAIRADGTIWGWGLNDYGQLGNGTKVNSNIPKQVVGVSGGTNVSAGPRHGLAVTSSGNVWVWGYNGDGELGDGTTADRLTPFRLPNLTGFTSVAAGYLFSLALKSDGTVWSWGYNNYGQLGNGTTTRSLVPTRVIGLSDVKAIAVGDQHAAALKNDGTVWAWGYNGDGQLGNGIRTASSSPAQVPGISDAIAIAAGSYHTLVILRDGSVWTWGYGSYGQLGDGSTDSQLSIVRASGLSNVVAISGGQNHSLAVKSDGTVWGWGQNSSGQLGNGNVVSTSIPVKVNSVTSGAAVAAGYDHSLALTNDGKIYSWGSNALGQFGLPSPAASTVPILTGDGYPGATNALSVSAPNYQITYQAGNARPVLQPILVSTTLAPVSFTASADVSWVLVTPSTGTTPATISVQVDPTGLTAGPHSGKIAISAPSLPGSTQQVIVNLTVVVPTNQNITAAPSSVSFTAQQNANPAPQTIILSSATSLAFQAQASSGNPPWLSVTPVSGTTPANLAVSVTPLGLAVGPYSGSITITGASGQTSTVPVSLTVIAPDPFDVTVPSLQFTVANGEASTQSLLVTNRSQQPLKVDVSSKNGLVTVSGSSDPIPVNGDRPYTLRIAKGSLRAGQTQYSDSVLVSAGGRSRELPLTVSIEDGAVRPILSSHAVTLRNRANKMDTDTTEIILLNAGTVPLAFDISHEQNWVDINPTKNVCKTSPCPDPRLPPGSTQTITISTNQNVVYQISHDNKAFTEYSVLGGVTYDTFSDALSVFLQVAPPDNTLSSPLPQLSPAGVLLGLPFQSAPNVTLRNFSGQPLRFNVTGPSWLTVNPTSGQIPAPDNKKNELYGVLNLSIIFKSVPSDSPADSMPIMVSFPDIIVAGRAFTLEIRPTYVGAPPSPSGGAAVPGDRTASCVPTGLGAVFASPGGQFQLGAGLPVDLIANIADNCGNVPTTGAALVSFSSGETPLSLTLWPDGLWRGTWQPKSPQDQSVTLRLSASSPDPLLPAKSTVTGQVIGSKAVPIVLSKSVIDAASQQVGSDTISPGEIVSIYGTNLTDQPVYALGDPRPKLGPISVTLGGIPLPLLYAGPEVAIAVVPFGLPLGRTLQLILSRDGISSVPLPLTVVSARPGIFTLSQTGVGQGAIVNLSGDIVNELHPAHRGDFIQIYCTGLGPVDQPVDVAKPAPTTPLPLVAAPVSVFFGKSSAEVTYQGLAPGFHGLYQLNVRVPANSPSGFVPIQVNVNGALSNEATIVVQ